MTEEQKIKIARMGGKAVSRNSAHMAKIGRRGGYNSWETRNAKKQRKAA